MVIDDKNLVFLISQPRSGSSLTQQLLLNCERLNSSPESWQMLSLIHTYKPTNIIDGYNPNYASVNFLEYLNTMDNGVEEFKQKIKSLAFNLYANKTKANSFFLDKTPRYYHIIDELYELFPKAKFIFLLRNPLSVFASMLDYNFKGDYVRFLGSKDRIEDLFTAPIEIEKAIKAKRSHIFIKYEDLVENPEQELLKVFSYLELDFPEGAETYEVKDSFINTKAIDTKSLKQHSKPSYSYLNSWKTSIDSTQKKILALDYVEELNKRHDDYFGYDLDEIVNDLRAFSPKKRTLFNLSMNSLISKEEQLSLTSVLKKRLILKMQRRHYV